ncbi:MAG: SRPBCC domain-containing protein [Piscinibacter sp.]|uniref:SRPBCC family protein n=1 Tax=Piscinibacter sp. TaxID=1903157 RepID=UPI003D13ADCF
MRPIVALLLLVLASVAGAQQRSIDKEVLVAAPIGEVWKAWTTRDGIVSFMAPDAEIEARVGGAFHVHFDPLAAPGMKGADDMRYMALQAPTLLSFDWNAPPHLPQVRAQRTFVVVRLKEVDAASTRVTLHHTGWGEGGEWDQAHAYFDRAWGAVLTNLKKRFDSGPVDWSDWMARLRKMHEQPAATPAARP